VSDTPPAPSNGGGGAKAAIELPPERYAMPDHSSDLESDRLLPPPLVEPLDEVNVVRVIRVYESTPKYESSTALGDAFAKAGLNSAQLADQEARAFDAPVRTVESDTVEATQNEAP
jgi:hypothetical protein